MAVLDKLMEGNLVTPITSDKVSVVTCINNQKVKDGVVRFITLDYGESYLPEHIDGIRLSPEWLEKAGFEKTKNLTYDLGKLSICLPGKEYKNGRTYFNSWCIIEGVPEFVHRLQNLHYALTQTELTINL